MFDLIPFGHREKNLYNAWNDFEKEFFGEPAKFMSGFKTDILDKKDRYVLQAELPGFSKEDIHIDINGDYLTISAEHNEDNEDTKDNYIRKERRYGSFSRSFNVADISTDKITASYQNGVLELDMPKRSPEPVQRQQITIN